jgi:hypothetical protein
MSEPSIPDTTEATQPTRPLLPHIPERQRGPVMNYFLRPVRAGLVNPAAIVRSVIAAMRRDLQQRHQWRSAAELDPFRQALLAVMAHPSEALALAQESIAHERLPDTEKQQRKAARAEAGRQAYMVSQPPTDKQIAYLRGLGVATAPANRLQASELIDHRVQGRGGHGR